MPRSKRAGRSARGGRTITADDLYRFRLITDSEMSPGGKRVVYVLQRVDRRTEKKYSNLWLVPAAGGRPLQFTYGDHTDSGPRWAPDGKTIAFLSNREDEKQAQIYVIPADGGEARRLTDLKGGFGYMEWSPDALTILCAFRKKDKEVLEMESDEDRKKLGIVARRTDRMFFKLDGSGLLPRERWHVWTVNARTGKATQLTSGDKHDDIAPSWSPDGRRIVFLSNRSPNPDLSPDYIDIFIMPARGGRPRPVPTPPGIKLAASFSPDGRTLAYYGIAGQGQHYKNMSLWVVPASASGRGGGALRVGLKAACRDAPEDTGGAAGRGDGRGAGGDGGEEPCDLTARFDINVLGDTIGDLRPESPVRPPAWSPDGERLYFTAGVRGSTTLHSVAVEGGRDARAVDGSENAGGGLGGPGKAGGALRGREGARTALEQGADRNALLGTHVGGPGAVFGFSLDRGGRRLAYLWGGMRNPVDLYVRDLPCDLSVGFSGTAAAGLSGNPASSPGRSIAGGSAGGIAAGPARRLTRINEPVLNRLDLGEIEEIWFKGRDRNDLHGFILKPPGFTPRRKYPAVLEIHGGPMTQYGHVFMHEFYYLAAHGYVVFFSNPRGSQGYGEANSKAIWGCWGKADYSDLMAWTELVARKPYVDSGRIGVTGGSYGGFMTNWIIGHTRRFKAAVTQRSIVNMISKYGTGDYSWLLCYRFGEKQPWEAPDAYWEQSPLKYFNRVKTPTLVIHSEEDHRCPIVEGEQTFVALKKMGVDTEMVRFPEEPHGLSRTGRTDRRIERLRHILRWFDKYLK